MLLIIMLQVAEYTSEWKSGSWICKNRYTSRGNEHSDYGRTSRQREILVQLMQKARSLDATTLLAVVNNMLPLITHNIDAATLTTLIANAPSYINYDIQTDRIPYDGLYSNLGEELVPDFEATINRLLKQSMEIK